MSHIFVSYSRKDIEFAQRIVDSLAAQELDTWIDWKSIPKTVDWEQEIYRGIEEADAFLFMVSPDSVQSEMCNKEIAHAVKNEKRIIPIVIRDADEKNIPTVVKKLNWIFCREEQDNFTTAVGQIREAIHTDYEWLKLHTKLQIKALEWERRKDASRLLRGKELREADDQLAKISGQQNPQPTPLQREYVLFSRRHEELQRRQIISGLSLGLLLMVALSIFAWIQRNNALAAKAKIEQQNKVALSRQLAAQAITLESGRYDLALLLAVQAYRTDPTLESQAALLGVLEYNPYFQTYLKHNIIGTNISVEYSSDGQLLASSACTGVVDKKCQQTEINIWDVNEGKLATEPFFIDRLATLRAISPDGQYLALIINDSDGNYVVLWSMSEQKVVKRFDHNANGLVFTPDGKNMITVGFDGRINIWNIDTGQRIGQPLIGHQSFVLAVAIDSTGNILATGGDDGIILLWDLPSRTLIGSPIYPGAHPIEHLAFSPDGQQLVSVSSANKSTIETGSLTLWDINTRTLRYSQDLNGFYGAVFSPQDDILAYANLNKIIVLDLVNLENQIVLEGQLSTTIFDLAFSPDGHSLVSSNMQGDVILWDLSSSHRLRYLIGNKTDDWVTSIDFVPDTQSFATTWLYNSAVDFWDVTSGQHVDVFGSVATGGGRSLSFSPDGKLLATGGDNQTVLLWDIAQKRTIGSPLTGHTSSVTGLAFSPDGKYLVSSAFGDAEIRLWDVEEYALVKTFNASDFADNKIVSVVFSPDGKSFAACGISDNIIIWEVDTARKRVLPISGLGSCTALEYSPDGSMIAVNSLMTGNVIVVKISDGTIVAELNLNNASGMATGFVFSPDGVRLVAAFCADYEAGCQQGTLTFWDVSTFQSLGQLPLGAVRQTGALDISPDNQVLVTGDNSGQVVAWDVSLSSWLYRACKIANRNLSLDEWEQYIGNDHPYALTCPEFPAGEGVPPDTVTALITPIVENASPPLFQLPDFSSPYQPAGDVTVPGQDTAGTPPGGWKVQVGELPDFIEYVFPAIIQCRVNANSDRYTQQFFGIWAMKNTQTDRWIPSGKAHVVLLDASGNEINSYPIGFAAGNNTISWLMPGVNIDGKVMANNVSPDTVLRLEFDSVEWQDIGTLVGDYEANINVESHSLYGVPGYPQHMVVFTVDNFGPYTMQGVDVFAVVQNMAGETVDLLRTSYRLDLASGEGGYFTAKSLSQSGRCVGKADENGYRLRYWVSYITEDGQLAEFYGTTNLK
jgi:WD40 repeat protein